MKAGRTGAVAFVGSGEFLPAMEPVDRALLERLGEEARVAIVPTASQPDGEEVFQRWLRMGKEHFMRLGAQVIPVALHTRADAEDPAIVAQLAEANFVYLSGGKPAYLRDVLQGTPAWEAIANVYVAGGVIAGCSAGAMVLAETMFDFRRSLHSIPALGLVPGLTIIPHFDEIPRFVEGFQGLVMGAVETGHTTIAGVEGNTALVSADEEWLVMGLGGVAVFLGHGYRRYTAGQKVAGDAFAH